MELDITKALVQAGNDGHHDGYLSSDDLVFPQEREKSFFNHLEIIKKHHLFENMLMTWLPVLPVNSSIPTNPVSFDERQTQIAVD